MSRLLAIALKEFRQLRRDRLTFGFLLVVPIVQILLFGYAANTDVRHIPTLIVDNDGSAASRRIVRSFEASGVYHVVGQVHGYHELESAFRRGEARAAVVFPDRFANALGRGTGAEVQLIVDGTDPSTVATTTCAASSVIGLRSREILLERAGRPRANNPLNIAPLVWFNADLRSSTYVVPGIIGLILSLTMVMLTSMAIARERERGTLEQIMVSPIRRSELIIGKILPYIAAGYVQMTVVLVAGKLIFQIPIAGSLSLLYALSFAFITASLALGLLLSTFAQTQQQAVQISLLFLLPNVMLSGFLYPFEAMPPLAQWLSQVLPFTHFLRIVRGILLKGSTFADLKNEFGWLCVLLLALVLLASVRFRKRMA